MTVIDVIEKRQKKRFLPSGFLQKSSLQNQKSTLTVKFNPCYSLEVAFFVLRFLGPSYSLLFWCILALPRFLTSRLHCILGNSQNF